MNQESQAQKNEIELVSNPTRMLTGALFNWIDTFGILVVATSTSNLTANETVNQYLNIFFSVLFLVTQIFLAVKGYTVAKVITGQQVINNKTQMPANALIQIIRPYLAQAWGGVLFNMYLFVTFFVATIGSLFLKKENTVYDQVHNEKVKAAAQVASAGALSYFFNKFPKLTWIYDTVLQTTVIKKSYTDIIAELKTSKGNNQNELQSFGKAS